MLEKRDLAEGIKTIRYFRGQFEELDLEKLAKE